MHRKSLLCYVSIFLSVFLFHAPSVSQHNRDLIASYEAAEKFYDRATALSKSADYDEKLEEDYNRRALAGFRGLVQKIPAGPAYDSIRYFTFFRIAELEHYFENYQEALAHYKLAIRTKQQSSLADSLLFTPYLYAGNLFYQMNQFDTAAFYFQQAERVQALYRTPLQETERLYNVLGVLNYEKGDYRHARNYFLKAIEVLQPSHPFYRELYTNYHINLAQVYFRLEDYDEANTIYQKLLALPYRTPYQNEIFHNIGTINLYLGAAAKALTYFRSISYPEGSKSLIRLYNNMGTAFINLGHPDSARWYLQKATDVHHALGRQTDQAAHGLTLKIRGDLEAGTGNPHAALKYYQGAIQAFYPAYADTSITANPSKFSGIFSFLNLFNVLVAKAEAFQLLFEKENAVSWAQQELAAYTSAFDLLSYVESTYNSDDARLLLNRTRYVVHHRPIEVAFRLFVLTKDRQYLEDVYRFDQQNKASILSFKQLTDQLAPANSPLTEQERQLKTSITRLSLRASQQADSTALADIRRQVRDLEIRLEKVQDRIASSTEVAPNRVPRIQQVQEMLDDETAIVSYHLSQRDITIFTITGDDFHAEQRPLPGAFADQVNAYVAGLRESNQEVVSAAGRHLHSLLIPDLDRDARRLIIVPDDELNYLPFEALQDSAGKFLVAKYSVQYQYSTSLLRRQDKDFNAHQTLSFAPFTKGAPTDTALEFSTLPNSLQEIRELDGKVFAGTSATKKNFMDHFGKFPVLHLATHAVAGAGEGQSFISFSPAQRREDFLLHTSEIYNIPLQNNELVILSACETGAGRLVRGEGILSLSRAFSYAGCPNVITTLWKADDLSTAYIMKKIHRYLDEQFSLDEAVRQAK
ncbi:MAG TPA: CHAT domain-containing tetratricopeptide repeat protein, partial [Flavisolibacter sp.]